MPGSRVELDCKTIIAGIALTLTVGGLVSSCTLKSYVWVDHQTAADLNHEEAISVLSKSLEKQNRVGQTACAIGKWGRWTCKTLGYDWRIRDDDAPLEETTR